jgi:hypothetical protein
MIKNRITSKQKRILMALSLTQLTEIYINKVNLFLEKDDEKDYWESYDSLSKIRQLAFEVDGFPEEEKETCLNRVSLMFNNFKHYGFFSAYDGHLRF